MVIKIERLPVENGVQKVRITSKDNVFNVEQDITPKIERHMVGQSVMHFYAIVREGVIHIGTPARQRDW